MRVLTHMPGHEEPTRVWSVQAGSQPINSGDSCSAKSGAPVQTARNQTQKQLGRTRQAGQSGERFSGHSSPCAHLAVRDPAVGNLEHPALNTLAPAEPCQHCMMGSRLAPSFAAESNQLVHSLWLPAGSSILQVECTTPVLMTCCKLDSASPSPSARKGMQVSLSCLPACPHSPFSQELGAVPLHVFDPVQVAVGAGTTV